MGRLIKTHEDTIIMLHCWLNDIVPLFLECNPVEWSQQALGAGRSGIPNEVVMNCEKAHHVVLFRTGGMSRTQCRFQGNQVKDCTV